MIMAQNEKGRRRANGIALTHTKSKSLDSFDVTNTAAPAVRQDPIGAIRLAQRFGLSVATAAAAVEANGWGRC